MDRESYLWEPVHSHMINQSIQDVSYFSQVHEIGPYRPHVQKFGDSRSDWHQDFNVSCMNDFIRKKADKILVEKYKLDRGQLTSYCGSDSKSQEPPRATAKHEVREANSSQQTGYCLPSLHLPSSMTVPALPLSSGPCSSNSPYFMDANTCYNMSSFNTTYDAGFFTGFPSSNFDGRIGTTFVPFVDEKSSTSAINQFTSELTSSPKPISSNTSGTDWKWYEDIGPFDGGQAFPDYTLEYIVRTSSEYCRRPQHCDQSKLNFSSHPVDNCEIVDPLPSSTVQISQQDGQKFSEPSGLFNGLISSTLNSTCEGLLQSQPVMTDSQQFQQRRNQSGMEFVEPFDASSGCCLVSQDRCCNETKKQKAYRVPQLLLEQSHGFPNISSDRSALLVGSTGSGKLGDLSNSMLHYVLSLYVKFKNMPVRSRGGQVSFLNYMHLMICKEHICRCNQYSILVSHFDNCHYSDCDICGSVREFRFAGELHQGSKRGNNIFPDGFCDTDFNLPSKRVKTESFISFDKGTSFAVPPGMSQFVAPERLPQLQQWDEAPVLGNSDKMKISSDSFSKVEDHASITTNENDVADESQELECKSAYSFLEELIGGCEQREVGDPSFSEIRNDIIGNTEGYSSGFVPLLSEEHIDGCIADKVQVRTETDHTRLEAKCDLAVPDHFNLIENRNDVTSNSQGFGSGDVHVNTDEYIGCGKMQKGTESDCAISEAKEEPPADTESGEQNIPGVSLTHFFTAEQIQEHMSSLRKFAGQGMVEEVPGVKLPQSVGENKCQLCGVEKLLFAPAPKYCLSCGALIKRNSIYYCGLSEIGTQHCLCTSCFRVSHGGTISFHGMSISKAKLHKEKNCEEDEESWVQCDKCKFWQHQICALYNDKRDCEGKAEYICPRCCLEDINNGKRTPLPSTAAFGAKDLPRSMLSDHIEKRLFKCLKQEREERAKALGKDIDEVPAATDLVVRVVLSVDKQLKVKQQYLDIFQDGEYPKEFAYRSKVILLYQNIQGVDVCLFGMYVQEFGSDCSRPNHRCVYISYIDSVKYFQPDVRTATGEALRTFVYHEILIAYLDYCKKRGFATCYIWACSPLKGEDYILYCHPETQKTPKPDKLRQWYKSMLRKAITKSIVVDTTNLYDHFFLRSEEFNSKITAARLPYFDGDYWSGAVEDMIRNIEEERRRGSQRKMVTKRTCKAMGHTNPTGGATKDILLMQKLGHNILPAKEDFIMVHLHFVCTRCDELILSGSRWLCNQCKNFQLCTRCHDVELNLSDGATHTCSTGERHLLAQDPVSDVASDTEDGDIRLDNSFFENRHTLLNFCQRNHYQFDSLRRAKHSSMMILYHLQNITATSVKTTCSICQSKGVIEKHRHSEGPEFDVCAACYHENGGSNNIYELAHNSTTISSVLINRPARQQKTLQERQMLDVLMHASECRSTRKNPCSYPKCPLMRGLFHHTRQCNLRVSGGCKLCQKTWSLLRLHSQNCRESDCKIPRCLDLKKHAEETASQLENRHRDSDSVSKSAKVC